LRKYLRPRRRHWAGPAAAIAGALIFPFAFQGLAHAGNTASHFHHPKIPGKARQQRTSVPPVIFDKIRPLRDVAQVPAWIRQSPEARRLRGKGILVLENTTWQEYADRYERLLGLNPRELKDRGEGNCLSCAIAGVRTLVGKPTRAEPKTWEQSVGPLLVEHGLTRAEKLGSVDAALERMRSARPGAKFILTIGNWERDDDGELAMKGHALIGVREKNELGVIDTLQDTFGSVLDQHYSDVALYRVDKGVRSPRGEMDTDPGEWTSGGEARAKFERVIKGKKGDHGYIKAQLNGKPVSYFVERTAFDPSMRGFIPGPGTRIFPLKHNLTWKEIQQVRPRETWRTWDNLTNPQFKLVPRAYGPTLETGPLDAKSPHVGRVFADNLRQSGS
jgi:hypothetical protein